MKQREHPFRSRLSWRRPTALAGAFLVLSVWQGMAATESIDSAGSNALPVITKVRELIRLPTREGQRHYPLRLRCVVTYFDPYWKTLFVQDDTAGSWVYRNFRETNFFTGQLLEIVGESDAVNVSAILPRKITTLGIAPLPAPVPVTYEQLVSGAEDGQWVQAQGVVRTMAYRFGYLKIDLASGSDHIPLYLPNFAERPLPTNLIGARIEVRGVSSMKINEDRQVTGFWFYVPSLDFVTIRQAGPGAPFSLEPQSIQSLTRYNPANWSTRIKVRGVVTLYWPSRKFFIQDETGPLEVRLLAPWVRDDPDGRYLDPLPAIPVVPGDVVEVVGYTSTDLAPVLVDAEYRRVGGGRPLGSSPSEGADGESRVVNGTLVSTEGVVLDTELRHADTDLEYRLVLQDGGLRFEAVLPHAGTDNLNITRGSIVRATGIQSVQTDRWRKTRQVQLLLRDARDIAVIRSPPRWTLLDAARLGAVAGGVMVVGLVWILVLRRRVAQRTLELAQSNARLQMEIDERKRAQSELARSLATEKELNQLKSRFVSMVSHEFRTPLGVILASADLLSDYLETLTPEERAEQIADIKQSTRHMATLMEDVLVLGRVEAGKVQFRPQSFELSDFCRRLIDELLSSTDRRCSIRFTEQDVDIPARGDEALLRHIFHNLLSNGVKYSAAGQVVELRVERDGEQAVFTVRDEGIGISSEDQKYIFDAFYRGSNVGERPGSGLGLLIVKRCVELHGGSIRIESVESRGTTVTVRLPLFQRRPQPVRIS